jgi:hypothetical protein
MERIRALLQGAAIVEQRNIARGRQVGSKVSKQLPNKVIVDGTLSLDGLTIEPNDQEEKEVQCFTL